MLMGKKIAIVALFAVLGLGVGAGITMTNPHPRAYQFSLQIGLPAHSRGTIIHLAALARSQHVQGVRVLVFSKREFQIVGYGSSASGASEGVDTVRSALPRLHPPYGSAIGLGTVGLVYSLWPAVIGLALGLAIGILVVIVRSRRAVLKRRDAAAAAQLRSWLGYGRS
jgi:hypothetical protein